MKLKIILYLVILFLIFLAGASITMFFIADSASDMTRIIKMHQVGDLRKELLINLQSVQSKIYIYDSPTSKELNDLVYEVISLNGKVQGCLACHHEPNINSRIMLIQSLVKDYESHVSYYITGRTRSGKIVKFKDESILIGDRILSVLMDMSNTASQKLDALTDNSTKKIKKMKNSLILTIVITLFFSIIAAFKLISSITKPVSKLLNATRSIASGNIGTTITHEDKTEFGELAENFNSMSIGLKTSYDELHSEIAERIKTEEKLRESEERYMLAAQGANDGLWDWDLMTNKVYYSPRWKSMLGYGENEIGESYTEWFSRIIPQDREKVQTELNAHIEGMSGQFQNEHRVKHKDGSYRWMLTRGLAVRNLSGKAYRMAGSQTDITERKIAEEQLVHDAFHDALTGLPNRALFMDRLAQAIRRKTRKSENLIAVLYIDIDRFKFVNDSLGHVAGDQLLLSVCRSFLECLRPSDTVARFGGDEFVILIEEISDTNDVNTLIKRMHEKVSIPYLVNGNQIFITLSIGIAFSYTNNIEPENLIRNADIAMYHAKANGRNRSETFNESMLKDVITSMKIESDLRKALTKDEFTIYYQPLLSLKDDRIYGLEALIRWNHPERGIIFPSEFIPIAEETGLILPIGKWVLSEACRQAAEWNRKFKMSRPLSVTINISRKQFNTDLVRDIKSIIITTGINAENVILEITETLLMENTEANAPLLKKLKDLGVTLLIDDFGTGYSSLSYLHNFPFDGLKIDRSFISTIGTADEKIEIIRAIITLAQNLNLYVVAEGVETSGQLVKIRNMGCDHIQGYLFAKPMSTIDAEAFLTDRHTHLSSLKKLR
ncbi:MAG: EAL domain-containing protein [Nitrospirae bacterium]|nr:EAL domain-containing protein [Nitrospirota bacterium]